MSFRCEKCDEPQPNRTKPVKLVTAWRTIEDRAGKQIAREKMFCGTCALMVKQELEAESN